MRSKDNFHMTGKIVKIRRYIKYFKVFINTNLSRQTKTILVPVSSTVNLQDPEFKPQVGQTINFFITDHHFGLPVSKGGFKIN